MSRTEIQHFIHLSSLFTFNNGSKGAGMIIPRYNIAAGCIEYYFIPSENVLTYQSARAHHEMDAHQKLGQLVDISTIRNAEQKS